MALKTPIETQLCTKVRAIVLSNTLLRYFPDQQLGDG